MEPEKLVDVPVPMGTEEFPVGNREPLGKVPVPMGVEEFPDGRGEPLGAVGPVVE